MYQVSLLQSLLYGDYQGSVTVGELKTHGNTGIGTFHRLNGELIMLEGEVYRAAGDGNVQTVTDEETVPFAVVAYVDGGEAKSLREIPDYDALCKVLDDAVKEKGINRFYMMRIDGMLRQVNVRSVRAQEEPYLPLTEVMRQDQTFFDYENIEGTLVGVYCPPYMASLNAVGWHLHFISGDRSKGGHVLGVNIADAGLTWDGIDGFEVRLPQNDMFAGFDLTVDQSADIKKVETNQ
jgi:acetolactate decarboxylase